MRSERLSEGTVCTTRQGCSILNLRHEMARKVSEYCALVHETTQPTPYGTGCVIKTAWYCLRESVSLLPPTPGTKTDQCNEACIEQNTRPWQRNCRQRGQYTATIDFPPPVKRTRKAFVIKVLRLGGVAGNPLLPNSLELPMRSISKAKEFLPFTAAPEKYEASPEAVPL